MRATYISLSATACAAAFFAAGCTADAQSEESIVSTGAVAVDWETFKQSAARTAAGKYVVEGDMAFRDEAALRRYWEEELAPSGQELTVNRHTVGGVAVDDIWAFPKNFTLTYCVGSGFTAAQATQLVPALEAAGQAWSGVVGVQFQKINVSGTCNSANNEVTFDVQRNTDGSFFGLSFFPGDARTSRTLLVDDTAFTTSSGGRTLTGILTHELGHSIGFRHEHIWVSCTGESTANARHVTAYDQSSVMHYPQCRMPQGGGYHITNLDYTGAVTLYGIAPSQSSTISFL